MLIFLFKTVMGLTAPGHNRLKVIEPLKTSFINNSTTHSIIHFEELIGRPPKASSHSFTGGMGLIATTN
jgi:hypothetical protein